MKRVLLVSFVNLSFLLLSFVLIHAQHDSPISALKQDLDNAIAQKANKVIAQKRLQLGELYQESGLSKEAVEQYNQAINVLSSEDTLYIELNNKIGQLYFAIDNFDLAKGYFLKALQRAKELSFLSGQARSEGLLGTCYEKMKIYDEALKAQQNSLKLFQEINDRSGICIAYSNLGSVYEDLENLDSAQFYFENAYSYSTPTNKTVTVDILNNLGDVHRKKGNYSRSLEYTKQGLELLDKDKDYDELKSAYKDMGKVYKLTGEFEKAYDNLLTSENYEELLFEELDANQIRNLQAIYEADRKAAEIELLKERNKVIVGNLRLLLVGIGALASIFVVVFLLNRRRRKAEQQARDFEQRTLKAELEKKAIEEKNLQQEIKLKTASLSKYSLHLAQKNKILLDISNSLKGINTNGEKGNRKNKIKEIIKEIDFNLQQENEWEEFVGLFEEIHPEFIKKLSTVSKDKLSSAELRLGVLLRLNLSSKEIASILRITSDSVRVARYRLRKKLPIAPKEDLVNFMVGL